MSDDIDYEALANAGYEAAAPSACSCGDFDFDLAARAVVAAYREQQRARGVVEVRMDDLAVALDNADRLMSHYHPDVVARLETALKDSTP
jgi:hypothetical protein